MRNYTIQKLTVVVIAMGFSMQQAQAEPAVQAPVKSETQAQVSALNKEGIGKAKEKDYFNAVGCFNKALDLDPKNFDSYVNRGWSFRQMGDFPRAISDYSNAIKIQSKRPQVYLNRGWCHKRLEQFDEAMNDFNKALELDPKYLNAYRNRGALKLKTGDYSGAIADFNQLLCLDPDAKNEVAKYGVPAELLESAQQMAMDPKMLAKGTKLAEAFKGTQIEITDTDLAKLNNRAAHAIKTGDFTTAIGILEDVRKKKPDYKCAKENLTTAYNNQGLNLARTNPEQSIDQFRKALFYSPSQSAARNNLNSMLKAAGKDPQSDAIRLQLGDELKAKGDYKGAFVEYMEALKLNKDADTTQRIAEIVNLIDQNKAPEAVAAQPSKPAAIVASARTTAPAAQTAAPAVETAPTAVSESATTETPAEEAAVEAQVGRVESSAVQKTAPVDMGSKARAAREAQARAEAEAARQAAETSSEGEPIAAIRSSSSFGRSRFGKTNDTNDGADQAGTAAGTTGGRSGSGEDAPKLQLRRPPQIGHDPETYRLKWHTQIKKGDELFDQGNYIDSEQEYKESLSTARKLGESSPELIDSLERLSRIFLIQKRPVEALSLLEQAYSLQKETGQEGEPGLERLGKKVVTLRHMLYPHDASKKLAEGDSTEDEEADDMAAGETEKKPLWEELKL